MHKTDSWRKGIGSLGTGCFKHSSFKPILFLNGMNLWRLVFIPGTKSLKNCFILPLPKVVITSGSHASHQHNMRQLYEQQLNAKLSGTSFRQQAKLVKVFGEEKKDPVLNVAMKFTRHRAMLVSARKACCLSTVKVNSFSQLTVRVSTSAACKGPTAMV